MIINKVNLLQDLILEKEEKEKDEFFLCILLNLIFEKSNYKYHP